MKDQSRPKPATTPLPELHTPTEALLRAYPAFAAGLKAAEDFTIEQALAHGEKLKAQTEADGGANVQYLAGLGYGYISGAAAVYALLTLHDPKYAAAFHQYCADATADFANMAKSARAEANRRKGETTRGH